MNLYRHWSLGLSFHAIKFSWQSDRLLWCYEYELSELLGSTGQRLIFGLWPYTFPSGIPFSLSFALRFVPMCKLTIMWTNLFQSVKALSLRVCWWKHSFFFCFAFFVFGFLFVFWFIQLSMCVKDSRRYVVLKATTYRVTGAGRQ